MPPNPGDIDPISGQLEAVQRALLTDTATVGRYGVSVHVRADGSLESVRIDPSVTPYGDALGELITQLAREALEQARDNVRTQLDTLTGDPRIRAVAESFGDAVEKPRPAPPPVAPRPARYADPDDELSEEELIELNQRRNQGFFRA
ncbi:YbaB/EbfC family nucleoid-associated protein [Nocardia sp. NBC_01329]|uniref:YbaB/EbfC family nucleoid-associated protein n=1 Tax=Nocardia sp. NBC_01329 TaxID=2903594 RepID=UPI002E1255C1|nr:YbaB/EbfC family nucleoid-associated protein [Nocardia sp. NBC_01329]